MTEAGWTRNAPTKEGWYWWQRTENDNPVVVWVNTFHPDKQLRAEMISGRRELLTHFNGLFKGPLTPDSYQQGRVAGRKEMLESFENHHDKCNDFRHCECAGGFWYEHIGKPWMDEKAAQQAQEGGVGDGN